MILQSKNDITWLAGISSKEVGPNKALIAQSSLVSLWLALDHPSLGWDLEIYRLIKAIKKYPLIRSIPEYPCSVSIQRIEISKIYSFQVMYKIAGYVW